MSFPQLASASLTALSYRSFYSSANQSLGRPIVPDFLRCHARLQWEQKQRTSTLASEAPRFARCPSSLGAKFATLQDGILKLLEASSKDSKDTKSKQACLFLVTICFWPGGWNAYISSSLCEHALQDLHRVELLCSTRTQKYQIAQEGVFPFRPLRSKGLKVLPALSAPPTSLTPSNLSGKQLPKGRVMPKPGSTTILVYVKTSWIVAL